MSSRRSGPRERREPQVCGPLALYPRERQVIVRLLMGEDNKTIARVLGVTESTVKEQVRSLLRKSNTVSRVQLVLFALRYNVVPTPIGQAQVDRRFYESHEASA